MDINLLEKRLAVWTRILFIIMGASITLFIQAVLGYQLSPILLFQPAWYGVWFIVELAAFLPGFVLLWGKHWMQLPLRQRLNTIFGYFAVAWFNLLLVGIGMGRTAPVSFNYFLLGSAIAITAGYWWLHRKCIGTRNEIFP
jgi:hypothetical protein